MKKQIFTIYDENDIDQQVIVRKFSAVLVDEEIKYFILISPINDIKSVNGIFLKKIDDTYYIDYSESFSQKLNELKNKKVEELDINLLNKYNLDNPVISKYIEPITTNKEERPEIKEILYRA